MYIENKVCVGDAHIIEELELDKNYHNKNRNSGIISISNPS